MSQLAVSGSFEYICYHWFVVIINIVVFQLGDQLYKRQNLPNNEMYRTLILLRKKGMCRKLFRGTNQTQIFFLKK